jgi:hypothetical protein
MAITIHYRGKLNDAGQLSELREELADLARSMGWESSSTDVDWNEPVTAKLRHTDDGVEIVGNLGLKGIELIPGSEGGSLSFLFDKAGNMRMPMHVVSLLEGSLDPDDAWVFVKTQFGSPDDHAWNIGLLKYLKKRYITDLDVRDEGEYWETGDMVKLKEKMDHVTGELSAFTEKLSSVDLGDVTGLSPEEIASRIEQLLDDEDDPAEEEGLSGLA